jgi:carboxyl-terminal processing protease
MLKSSLSVRLAVVAFAALLLGACASIPYARTYEPPGIALPADGSPERAELNAEVYDSVVRYVDKLFYKPEFGGVPFEQEAEARRAAAIAQSTSDGLHGDLSQLLDLLDDDHTVTLSPLQRLRYFEQLSGGSATGYGFTVTPRGDDRYVASVRPDSPAQAAGVLPGWRIESAGGQPVLLARPAILGRVDTLVFVDEAGDRHSRDLEGVSMPHRPRFASQRLEEDIAYIRFDDFDAERYRQYMAEFEAMANDPPAGLIIDLRTNGGGQLNVTGQMSGWLYADRRDYAVIYGRFSNTRFFMLPAPKPYLGPVVMLIGPGSASAAELFAGVAQEKERAVIVGQTSRGAVTGTRPIELADGGLLRVGTIVMTTPAGKQLEGVGVTPDIVVPDDWQAVREGRDPTLAAGISAIEASMVEATVGPAEVASAADGPDIP